MSYRQLPLSGVTDESDEALLRRCQQEAGAFDAIAGKIAKSVAESPCVELEVRHKISTYAKKYGPPVAIGILVLGIVGGAMGRSIFKG